MLDLIKEKFADKKNYKEAIDYQSKISDYNDEKLIVFIDSYNTVFEFRHQFNKLSCTISYLDFDISESLSIQDALDSIRQKIDYAWIVENDTMYCGDDIIPFIVDYIKRSVEISLYGYRALKTE